jgi:hypothetical protein
MSPFEARFNDVGRLRIAARVESPDVPAWAAAVLAKIAPHADVVLVVAVPPSGPSSLRDAYLRYDRRFLRLGLDPLAPDDSLAFDVRALTRQEDAAAPILAAGVDLVLDLSTHPDSALPAFGRFGTWRVRLGSPDVRDLLAIRRDGQNVFALDIVARLGDGQEVVVERSISAIDSVSISRTVEPSLWKATAMLERSVRRTREAGALKGTQTLDASGADGASPLGMVGVTVASLARLARRRVMRALWQDEWFLAARVLDENRSDGFRRLSQAPNGYRADPFVFEHGGRVYLFFEEFDYARGRGHISVGVLDRDGRLGPTLPCLVPDYHVSYPGVFEHDGSIYMIPETVSRRRISLYRADDFPTSWRPVRDLISGIRAVDPTAYFDGERWWLFASVYERGAPAGDELFVWWAESLTGEWAPHRANPVVSDVRCARPAGMLYRSGDDLIRPAQDGSRGYGSGMTLRRIVELTPESYREETVGAIDASWLPNARMTHTLNRTDSFEVTDGEARRFRLFGRARRSA